MILFNKFDKFDIDEDDIRIIRPKYEKKSEPRHAKRRMRIVWIVVAIVAAVAAVAMIAWISVSETDGMEVKPSGSVAAQTSKMNTVQDDVLPSRRGFVDISDTVVDGRKFSILSPIDATPSLHIGGDILNDTTALLVAQAADFRGDNGEIAGAYVYKGNLVSKGQAKPGFCAIINGEITIGVAEATPLLEEAIESNGYFFRQYPLVVGGQIVENRPKGKSLRKALATINGRTAIIMSHDRMTFHDFSKSLADLGVTNAIYLVGSTAYGFARKENGETVFFGEKVDNIPPNSNYIVWR